MKWILISVICLFMIVSLAICQDLTGQRLNLEIVPPLKTPPASLNEISKYDTADDKFIGDTIGEDDNDDDISKLDVPLEDEEHINEDKDINKKLKLEDYKFNPYIKIDEDTGLESEEYNNRAIFLARFLDPENLKYLRARIRRSPEPQQQNPSSSLSENNSENNGGKKESAPVPDDEEKADRFLNT